MATAKKSHRVRAQGESFTTASVTSEIEREVPRTAVAINFVDQKAVDRAGRNHDIGLHGSQSVTEGIAKPGQAIDLALNELGVAEQLIKAVPELGRMVDGGLEGVAKQVVEAPVTGIEQVEHFDSCFLGGKMLNGLANVPCGDVFPLAETGC